MGNFYAITESQDTLYSFQYDRYIWSNSIKINTDTFCNRDIDLCKGEDLKVFQKYFYNKIYRNYRMPSVESKVLDLIVIDFVILENGAVCNIEIVKSNGNPFFEKAILNVFAENGFKYLASKTSNCKVRLALKEPCFEN